MQRKRLSIPPTQVCSELQIQVPSDTAWDFDYRTLIHRGVRYEWYRSGVLWRYADPTVDVGYIIQVLQNDHTALVHTLRRMDLIRKEHLTDGISCHLAMSHIRNNEKAEALDLKYPTIHISASTIVKYFTTNPPHGVFDVLF